MTFYGPLKKNGQGENSQNISALQEGREEIDPVDRGSKARSKRGGMWKEFGP